MTQRLLMATISLTPQIWGPQPQGPAKVVEALDWWGGGLGVGKQAELQAQGQDSVPPATHPLKGASCVLGPAGTARPPRDPRDMLAWQGKLGEMPLLLQMAASGKTQPWSIPAGVTCAWHQAGPSS